MIVQAIIFIAILMACICIPIYLHRKKISHIAEQKWEDEDKTIFIPYGNYLIPMLKSQTARWVTMTDEEKWWMLNELKDQVKKGKLTTSKENGITRFDAITPKGKDIAHRQKQRTEGWKTSPESN